MRLKEYLIKNDIKMTHFAKTINYQKGNLSRILNGSLSPSYSFAIRVQKATNNEVMPIDLQQIKKEVPND
jgi:plasmid maintenance system antidote protein VapI